MSRNFLISKTFWVITGMLILIVALIVAICEVDKQPPNVIISYTEPPVITAEIPARTDSAEPTEPAGTQDPVITPVNDKTPDPENTKEPTPTPTATPTPTPTPTQRPTEVPDTEPPVFTGLKDIYVYLGDSISYKSGVKATDNIDGEVEYTIDRSAVNTSKKGTYYAYYTAMDKAGNVTTVQRKICIMEKPVINEESVTKLIDGILKDIITNDMSKAKKLEKIYNWVYKNIKYAESDEKTDLEAAYWGIKNGYGDCYNYYAITHLMLDRVGIDNIMVKRYHKDTTSSHYWLLVNVGTGWYHLDTTPTSRDYPFKCFMKTDAEIYAYNKTRPDKPWYYSFNESLYPERATEKYSG